MEPRITLVTLGVGDLPRAVRFYRDGLGWPTTYEDGGPVAFFETNGTRLGLYPREHLAADISPDIPIARAGFSGITLAHNVRSKEEADAVMELAKRAGGRIVRPTQDAFWGGYSGYFTDPDGHYWEVAWNPILPLDDAGVMTLKPERGTPPVTDPTGKVENVLRWVLVAGLVGVGITTFGSITSEIFGTRESVGFKLVIAIMPTLVLGFFISGRHTCFGKGDTGT
jgi:catechol 2,3-dioxygenase-like lactoylglutathione lyase family enzyme